MAKAPQFDASGAKTKDVTLDDAVFAVEIKPHLVHEAVRAELNAQRAGTSATKSRGLVSGGRAKPWRQKGTGRARQGTIRAPQFEGGGHAFAKVPRTYIQKVNRKAAKAALRSALASHVGEGSLAIVDATAFDKPATKQAGRPAGKAAAAASSPPRARRASSRASVISSVLRSSLPESSTSPPSSGRARCSSPRLRCR